MRRSDIARLRMVNQRFLKPSFRSPAGVVRWFGAVQSQDLASSLYAIGLRMRDASEATVERAIAGRSIVRSWPMRRTIHCMPAEDARWMVRLLAPRQIARMAVYHRRLGITNHDLERAGKVLHRALAGGKQLTRLEIYGALNAAGVATDAPEGMSRGLHFITHWAQAGLICMASRSGKQHSFALLDEWAPRGRELSGDDAYAELASRYVQSHGPATVADFAWWAGLTMPEAKRSLGLIADSLKAVTIDGAEYWLIRDLSEAVAGPLPVLLLPAFDEYTVGYADRSAAVDEAILATVNHGLAAGIYINGRMAGTWKRALSGKSKVTVLPNLFRKLTNKERTALRRAAERYAMFLGGTLVAEKFNASLR
jgi:winged helix DNA-binding protein